MWLCLSAAGCCWDWYFHCSYLNPTVFIWHQNCIWGFTVGLESSELRRKIPASLWGNYKSFLSHSDIILMLLHWTRILSFISTLLPWMGFSQLWEEGGQSWALTKSLIHKAPAAPGATSPSTPEAATPWQEKLGHQTNSRPPLQQLFPGNSMSALPHCTASDVDLQTPLAELRDFRQKLSRAICQHSTS